MNCDPGRRREFARSVVVHASANGYDSSGILDAVAASGGRVIGVAVVSEDTAPDSRATWWRLSSSRTRFEQAGF